MASNRIITVAAIIMAMMLTGCVIYEFTQVECGDHLEVAVLGLSELRIYRMLFGSLSRGPR